MSKNTKTTESASSFTIKEAARILGMSEMYIRRSIQKGTLKAISEKVPNTNIDRWSIPAAELEAWRTRSKTHSKRADGRVRRIVYLSQEEEAALAPQFEIAKPQQHKKAKKVAEPVEAE